MYLIDHMNIHLVQLNSLDGPCTLVHVPGMSDYSTAYHTKLKDNKLCKYTIILHNGMKHIQKRLHTGLQLTNNNDEGELSCKLVSPSHSHQISISTVYNKKNC